MKKKTNKQKKNLKSVHIGLSLNHRHFVDNYLKSVKKRTEERATERNVRKVKAKMIGSHRTPE